MLWEVDIYPAKGEPDLIGRRVAADAADLGLGTGLSVSAARGYLIQGELELEQVRGIADRLLADQVVERTVVGRVGEASLFTPPDGRRRLVHVLPKPGVMDPVAQSAAAAMRDLVGEDSIAAVRTL